jgi:hypothetical protein
MDCPQCDAVLASYVLDGREAVVCESCGYVGIPADHRGDGPAVGESWDDALRRYHEQHPPVGRAGARVPVLPDGTRPDDDETWDEALARFDRNRTDAARGTDADRQARRPPATGAGGSSDPGAEADGADTAEGEDVEADGDAGRAGAADANTDTERSRDAPGDVEEEDSRPPAAAREAADAEDGDPGDSKR